MNATFRPQRLLLPWYIVFAVLFLTATAANSLPFFLDKPPGFQDRERGMMIASLGLPVFGSMAMLSIYEIVAICIGRFSVVGTMIIVRSPFQNRQFDASSLQQLAWNTTKRGGQLVFDTTTSKATLHLSRYRPKDRLQIIRIVRQLVPVALQNGWPEFCHFIALPLLEGRISRQPGETHIIPSELPESARVFVTRRRYDLFFGVLFLLSLLAATMAWWQLGLLRAFLFPVLPILFWVLLRFSTPKSGRWVARWPATTEGRIAGISYISLLVLYALLKGLKFAGFKGMIAVYVALILFVPLCGWSMWYAKKRQKQQRIVDEQQSPISVDRWQFAETSLSGDAASC